MQERFTVPVVLFTFNRPALVEKQLWMLRKIRPKKIFYVSDAARREKPGEEQLVLQSRKLSEEIDWECELDRIYADENMGCDRRIVSALDYVFSVVDQAIILEDDCLPCVDFFRFCQEVLEKYAADPGIMYISGSKWVPQYPMEYSYGFSYNTGTWGWATWRRAWQEWHWDKVEWEEKKNGWLKGVYSCKYRKNWIKDVERYIASGVVPWDYVWRFCVGKRLSIFPAVNLIENIGFGEDATHTKGDAYGYDAATGELREITHPAEICEDLEYPRAVERQFTIPLRYRVKRKIKKYLSF